MTGEIPTSPLDKPVGEMTNAEKRGKIARLVGTKTYWPTALDKDTLNSVYAALTGEFHTPHRAMYRPDHPEFVSRNEMLFSVVIESDIGGTGDDWGGPIEECPSMLRGEELEALIGVLRERGDQRAWTPDGTNGEEDDAAES